MYCCCLVSYIDRERKNEHNPADIILPYRNTSTYQNIFAAHARRYDDVFSYEYN